MKLLCSKKRETVFHVEAHLIAEYTVYAGAGTVILVYTVFFHIPEKVEILFHCQSFFFLVIVSVMPVTGVLADALGALTFEGNSRCIIGSDSCLLVGR